MIIRSVAGRAESVAILSFAALFIVFSLALSSVWFGNVPTLMRDISWLGLIAIGQALVVISGEFDLSVGSTFGFVGLIFVLLLQAGIGAPGAVVLALLAALGIGALNGLLTWNLSLPSLLVTLGFLFVYRGLIQFSTEGFPAPIPDEVRSDGLITFLGGSTSGLQNSVLICAVVLVVVSFVLTRTRFGAHIASVGGDLNSAKACGVQVGRIKVFTFMICSALAGLAGIIAACKLSSVSATTGDGLELESIAAVVIGGCSLRGGIGSAWGAVLGVASLMALKAGLILMGVNIFIYQLLLGSVLVGLIATRGLFPKLLEAK